MRSAPTSSTPGVESSEWLPKLRDPHYSQSLIYGLAILRCFTPSRTVLGIADLADELSMGRSTTHRYVVTLVALGYLEQEEASRKYRLGLKVTDLGMNALNSTAIRNHAQSDLKTLVRRTNFTGGVTVLDGTEIRCLNRVRAYRRGYHASTPTVNVGSRQSAAVTASGKLLVAHLPRRERDATLAQISLKQHGPNTIMTKAELREQFVVIRETGLAIDDQEQEAGFHAIAAPLRDESTDVVAAINLVAPQKAITLERLVSAIGPLLCSTADDISVRLGYPAENAESERGDDE